MKIEIKTGTLPTSPVAELEYIFTRPLRISHKGKHWPKTTQCIFSLDGYVLKVATVVKHENDVDNPFYAIKLVTKDVLKATHSKWLRKEFWKIILSLKDKDFATNI